MIDEITYKIEVELICTEPIDNEGICELHAVNSLKSWIAQQKEINECTKLHITPQVDDENEHK